MRQYIGPWKSMPRWMMWKLSHNELIIAELCKSKGMIDLYCVWVLLWILTFTMSPMARSRMAVAEDFWWRVSQRVVRALIGKHPTPRYNGSNGEIISVALKNLFVHTTSAIKPAVEHHVMYYSVQAYLGCNEKADYQTVGFLANRLVIQNQYNLRTLPMTLNLLLNFELSWVKYLLFEQANCNFF